MKIRMLISALRSPILLCAGVLLVVLNKSLIANLVLLMNYYGPRNAAFGVLRIRPDYVLYLPNAVVLLGYLVGIFALLEFRRLWCARNKNLRSDLVTAAIGFGVALSSVLFMSNMKPGMLQILISGIPVVILWFFMMANADLWVFHRFVSDRRWFVRLVNWTFPVSDIVFYMFHRHRLRAIGWVKFIPSLSFMLLAASMFGLQGRILWGSVRAERLDAPIITSQWALHDENGLWFSNDDWWDPLCGIWYFDERSRETVPVIRAADVRIFHLEDGYFYFHDRYQHQVIKMDAETYEVIWKVAVERTAGTFDLWIRDDWVVAQGEGGYIIVLDKDGQIYAERDFVPIKTWCFQIIEHGRLAFLSGDQRVRFCDLDLTNDETIPLPVAEGVFSFPYDMENGGYGGFGSANWTDYEKDSATLYVSTLWGEIFRYDTKNLRWLSSLKTHPGMRAFKVDSHNGLVFALNHFQGYIDVLDLDSGNHVGYILANALGRHINVDPVSMRGALSTHGYGLYRFNYGELVRRRETRAVVSQDATPKKVARPNRVGGNS